jgi:hypothetical protein
VKRKMVAEVMTTHKLSQRRACGLIRITRRGLKRAPGEDRNRELRELAEERRRWDCPLLYLMLRRVSKSGLPDSYGSFGSAHPDAQPFFKDASRNHQFGRGYLPLFNPLEFAKQFSSPRVFVQSHLPLDCTSQSAFL